METDYIGIDDQMPLGKFSGSSLRHVLAEDPDYLRWFAEEVEIYELDMDVLAALESEGARLELIGDENFE